AQSREWDFDHGQLPPSLLNGMTSRRQCQEPALRHRSIRIPCRGRVLARNPRRCAFRGTAIRGSVRRILLAWMLGVAVVGEAVAGDPPTAQPVIGSTLPGQPISVLFVGNSYTFYNDLPQMVRRMSVEAAQPRPLQVRDVTFGG